MRLIFMAKLILAVVVQLRCRVMCRIITFLSVFGLSRVCFVFPGREKEMWPEISLLLTSSVWALRYFLFCGLHMLTEVITGQVNRLSVGNRKVFGTKFQIIAQQVSSLFSLFVINFVWVVPFLNSQLPLKDWHLCGLHFPSRAKSPSGVDWHVSLFTPAWLMYEEITKGILTYWVTIARVVVNLEIGLR